MVKCVGPLFSIQASGNFSHLLTYAYTRSTHVRLRIQQQPKKPSPKQLTQRAIVLFSVQFASRIKQNNIGHFGSGNHSPIGWINRVIRPSYQWRYFYPKVRRGDFRLPLNFALTGFISDEWDFMTSTWDGFTDEQRAVYFDRSLLFQPNFDPAPFLKIGGDYGNTGFLFYVMLNFFRFMFYVPFVRPVDPNGWIF